MIADLYTDMRILLGWAWTYLIVAELIGTSSGITYFINQQARYRNYDNVYAAIMMIGLIGLGSDLLLARLGRALFPWRPESRARAGCSALVARTRCAAAARAGRGATARPPMDAWPARRSALPSYRDQPPTVAARFARIYAAPGGARGARARPALRVRRRARSPRSTTSRFARTGASSSA